MLENKSLCSVLVCYPQNNPWQTWRLPQKGVGKEKQEENSNKCYSVPKSFPTMKDKFVLDVFDEEAQQMTCTTSSLC